VVAWLVATLLFVGMVLVWNGRLESGDSGEVDPAAAAIAHGELTCGFVDSLAPPLYELVAAGYASALNLGSSEPYPSPRAGKPVNCQQMQAATEIWAHNTHEERQLLNAGYLVWPVLLAGFVALLRAAKLGRSRLEVVGVCLLGLAPQVSYCLNEHFHPDELLALGLGLAAFACTFKDRWALAGIFAGLGLVSHQVGILAAVVLFVVGPRTVRVRFAVAVAVVVLAICLPIIALSNGGELHGIFFSGVIGKSPSLVSEISGNLRGLPLVALSRVVPLVLTILFGLAIRRRIGDAIGTPFIAMAMLAFAVLMRLLFDVALYGYYLAWAAVALLALDLLAGRLRAGTVAWIIGTALIYPTLPTVDAFSQVHPVIAQCAVVLSGLALAVTPLRHLARSGTDTPAVQPSTPHL